MMLILFVGIVALALSVYSAGLHEHWWSLLLALVAGFSFGQVAAYLQVVDVLGRAR